MADPKQFSRLSSYRLGGENLSSPLRAGVNFDTNGEHERHFYTTELAFVYIYDGSGKINYKDGTAGEISPGDLFIRFPKREHAVVINEPTWKCYVAVPGEILEIVKLFRRIDPETPVFSPGRQREIVHGFLRIAKLLETEEDLYPVYRQMIDFMIQLIDRSKERRVGQDSVLRIKQWINQNPASRISLEKLAARFEIGYHSLRKSFAESSGMSPGEYRIRKRIEHAANLLKSGTLSVGEVAEKLGYSDIYTFSKQFKKVTGVSPSFFKRL